MERPSLILLVGLPGSGKTTYANSCIFNCHGREIHLSSDSIRAELYGDESVQGDQSEVFALMQKRAVEALNDGKYVVYDATNITRKDRSSIIVACPKFAKIECHIIWAPIEVCIERDAARERTVGKEIIDKMLKRFQAPYYDEGIDEIKIVKPDNFADMKYYHDIVNAMHIPHDNHHHTLTIQEHCVEAFETIECMTTNRSLLTAAWYHDIGKPYVKAFIDSKGNPCDEAHYYQHQCVGAWMSYGMNEVTSYEAWLISTHMDPFMDTKYYRNLPAFLKKDIDLLHEADLAAH
jgi:putative nucleotidyltransferase with HDIG domain